MHLKSTNRSDRRYIRMKEWDANADCAESKALAWAARRGYEDVVKMLLEREDVNPNMVDKKSGRTPLSLAAECGHEGIVKIILGRKDVNPNTVGNKYGRAPLSLAAEHG